MNLLSKCELCPHGCGVDREIGELGFCKSGNVAKVFRYGAHFGEEPPISGTKGSGTIFFSNCTMRCIYCQNYKWSQQGAGKICEEAVLTSYFRELYELGCHNWNLVSPTPWLPLIKKAVKPLFSAGIRLPFVYNTSGYESISTLEEFSEFSDIALIDLRYSSNLTAMEGSGCSDYVENARMAVEYFWKKLGGVQCDSDGIAKRGVICRLLALPGRENEVVDNLRWLKRNIGTDITVSVMAQYMPVYLACERSSWNRKILPENYGQVLDALESLGFENGFVQACEDETAENMLGEDMSEGLGEVK